MCEKNKYEIRYAYPSSCTAIDLNKDKTGCYYVVYVADDDFGMEAFDTLEDSRKFALSLRLTPTIWSL